MKVLFLHIFFIWATGSFVALGQTDEKLVKIDTEASYVEIHGSTNINSFNCSYKASLPENQFEVAIRKTATTLEIDHEPLFLKVLNFECPNPQMTEDLHDLLEHKNYPFIIFQLNKIINSKTAHVMIEMAGEQQSYLVNLNSHLKTNTVICTATMELTLSDFGLEAPEKFFGMVKVNENIEVEFKIKMNIHDK